MCLGTHGAEDAAAAAETSFTNTLLAQGKTLFNQAQSVFNTMTNAYTSIVNAGPSQRGYSIAQKTAQTAAAVTAGAQQTRFAEARVAGQQAGAGGGNVPSASGIGAGARADIASRAGAETAKALNAVEAADWAQGNKNWQFAGEGLGKAGQLTVAETQAKAQADKNIQSGLATEMNNAAAADARSNWWVKPVMGLAGAGLNMVVPGLGTAVTGGSGGANPFSGIRKLFSGGGGAPSATPPGGSGSGTGDLGFD